MEEWNIHSDGEGAQRQAYRTRIPGFAVKFQADGRVFEVKDLSATGFAVEDPAKNFAQGSWHQVQFFLNKKPFLNDVNAVVIRVGDNGIVGLNFENLERRQVIKLDKLVLEVQKRLIQLRKAKENK